MKADPEEGELPAGGPYALQPFNMLGLAAVLHPAENLLLPELSSLKSDRCKA
jgi:hypothetical protein